MKAFDSTQIRRVRLGAWCWIASLQFFVVQWIVQRAWTTPYSLRTNYISDLGNTACAPFPPDSVAYVCSPWHALMNASFVITGVTIVLGSVLLAVALRAPRARVAALALLVAAGIGFVLVGLFPENVDFPPHRLGAALQFVLGNLALVVVGASLIRSGAGRRFGLVSMGFGMAGLVATALFVSRHYLGLGIGGMERVAAYPLPLWTIAAGAGLARARGER